MLETVGRGLQYGGYALGQGVGSTLPSVVTGGLAAMATVNPFVGLAVGAFGPSYGQNWGDVYTLAKEDPDIAKAIAEGRITPKQVAGYLALAAVPMAALDTGGLETGLGLATGKILHDLKLGLVKKMALGAFTEGGTEAMQEVLSDVTQKYLGSNKPASDYLHGVVDNFLGGAITGGAMTGAGHVVIGRPQVEPPPPPKPPAGLPPGVEPVQPATPGAPPEKPLPGAPISTSPLAVESPIVNVEPRERTPLGTVPGQNLPMLITLNKQLGRTEALLNNPATVEKMGKQATDYYTNSANNIRGAIAKLSMNPNEVAAAAAAPPVIEPEIIPPGAPLGPEANATDVNRVSRVPDDISAMLIAKAMGGEDFTLPKGPVGLSDLIKMEQKSVPVGVTVDLQRMMKLTGKNLYGDQDQMPMIVTKELLQNAVDSIRPIIEQGKQVDGNVHIKTDSPTRTITMTDNGTGMTPETLAGPFLQIAGTKKESGRAGGGFGIAKMMTLFANHAIRVITMRDGQVSELNSTGPELEASAGWRVRSRIC